MNPPRFLFTLLFHAFQIDRRTCDIRADLIQFGLLSSGVVSTIPRCGSVPFCKAQRIFNFAPSGDPPPAVPPGFFPSWPTRRWLVFFKTHPPLLKVQLYFLPSQMLAELTFNAGDRLPSPFSSLPSFLTSHPPSSG